MEIPKAVTYISRRGMVEAKGFSLEELRVAGLSVEEARKLGLNVDEMRPYRDKRNVDALLNFIQKKDS